MTRPTCGTCPHYVGDHAGTCRESPPTLGIVLRLQKPSEEPTESKGAIRPSQSWYGRWPAVEASWACCGRHPMHPAWSADFQAVAKQPQCHTLAPEPPDDPF